MSFSDQEQAAAFRDVVRRLVQRELDNERPSYKYATVVSIDAANRTCDVQYGPNDDPVTVKLGSIIPKDTGQTVRIAGQAGDRFVDDVIGETGTLDVAAPSAPSGLAGLALDRGVRLTWRAAEAGLLYLVQIATDVAFTSLADNELSVGGNFIERSGLLAGQEYFLRVRAVDTHGNRSPWSAVVRVETPSEATGSVSDLGEEDSGGGGAEGCTYSQDGDVGLSPAVVHVYVFGENHASIECVGTLGVASSSGGVTITVYKNGVSFDTVTIPAGQTVFAKTITQAFIANVDGFTAKVTDPGTGAKVLAFIVRGK